MSMIIVPCIMSEPEVARCAKAKQDLRALSLAIENYKNKTGSYPVVPKGLKQLLKPEPIIRKIPNDPWLNDYKYTFPTELNSLKGYDLYSYGVDGKDDMGKNDDIVAGRDFECNPTDKYRPYIILGILITIFILTFIGIYKLAKMIFTLIKK